MLKEKLTEFAQMAEIVAALAVVVSLLYVGKQVQDNTSAIQSASVQAVANAADSGLQTIAANEDLARLRYAGDLDFNALSELDRYRYQIYSRGQWIRMQNAFSQHQLGVLDEDFWRMLSQAICQTSRTSGGFETFKQTEFLLNTEFVAFVKACPDSPNFAQ